MDLDPLDMVAEPSGFEDAQADAAVAITVALLATFMGICKRAPAC